MSSASIRFSLVLFSAVLAWSLSAAAVANEEPAEAAFSDTRDGKSYKIVVFGPIEWMARNLDHATADSRCYEDQPALCAQFGRLYRIHDALTACPAGWRLPSESDWQSLETSIGLAQAELERDKARGLDLDRQLLVGGKSGFEGMLSGWYDAHLGKYQALGRSAGYWASTTAGPRLYWHRDLMPARGGIWRSAVDDSYWLSVHCVRPRR